MGCMKECTPGGLNGPCEGVVPHMREVAASPGGSLFCFSCYTANTGSEKVSHELELLLMQHQNAWNIFSCAEWAVYSDVEAPLGGGDMTIKVEDVKNDFHFAKRMEASMGRWERTYSPKSAWICWVSPSKKTSDSRQTEHAKRTDLSGRKKTRSTSRVVLACLRLQSTPSRSPRLTPSAGRRLPQCSHENFSPVPLTLTAQGQLKVLSSSDVCVLTQIFTLPRNSRGH